MTAMEQFERRYERDMRDMRLLLEQALVQRVQPANVVNDAGGQQSGPGSAPVEASAGNRGQGEAAAVSRQSHAGAAQGPAQQRKRKSPEPGAPAAAGEDVRASRAAGRRDADPENDVGDSEEGDDARGDEDSSEMESLEMACKPSQARIEQIFGDDPEHFLMSALSAKDRRERERQTRIRPSDDIEVDLPRDLFKDPTNPNILREVSQLRLPGPVIATALRLFMRTFRDAAFCWLALAAFIDDLRLDKERKRTADELLGGLESCIKLMTTQAADMRTAMEMAHGKSEDYARLFNSFRADGKSPWKNDTRLGPMRESAKSVEEDRSMQRTLSVLSPNSRKSGKKDSGPIPRRFSKWFRYQRPRTYEPEPSQDREQTQSPSASTEQEQKPKIYAKKRPFRGKGRN